MSSESELKKLIHQADTPQELFDFLNPEPPEITPDDEIAKLFPRSNTRANKLEPYDRSSRLCDIWFNQTDYGHKLGYKTKTNFARNIPTTATLSMAALEDDSFNECNRVMVLLKKRNRLDYVIIKEYFTKVQGSHIGEQAVAKNLKRQGVTYYMVTNGIPVILGWLETNVNWKLI